MQSYNKNSDTILHKIVDLFELQIFSNDIHEKSGVINIKIPLIGEYVFNKQPPLTEIWVSSPLSGPKHFRSFKDGFYENKTNVEIMKYLNDEIKVLNDKIKSNKS